MSVHEADFPATALRDAVSVDASPTGVSVDASRERHWCSWYVPAAVVVDLGSGFIAGLAALGIRFGTEFSTAYGVASVLFPLLWVGALAGHHLYEARFLGTGAEEYRRVLNAGMQLAAVIAIVAYWSKTDVARGYIALAVPLVVLLDLVGRHLLRTRLRELRKDGKAMQRVVAVGHAGDVVRLVEHLRREPSHGLLVVGACLPEPGQVDLLLHRGIPAVGGFDNVERTVKLCSADTVAVVSNPEMSGDALRRLAWKLEASNTALIVSPGLVEVAGPRLSIRPAAGLSLLHVEPAALEGARRMVKVGVDRLVSLSVLIMLAPLMAAIAIAIRLTSDGPAIYRQARVGQGGRLFTMYKFRTMVADAHARRTELLEFNEKDGVLFKMRRDPRVTRVGGILRRYSIDELPQLVNVLFGHMSLVGPRPPLPEEVAVYPEDAHRRLVVKPGLTGLWQVSGRADLSWEESLRLDLRYVDNWSLALDALIVWKTGRAVINGSGAY